ncbi:hypothetical protein ACUN22_04340 [Streptomyces anulatus]|uniref:hypothetical protein n=1 Tax=Streptomyces anulatus TaxID=1892 RepID=UPI00403DBC44
MSRAVHLFFDPLARHLRRYAAMPFLRELRVVPAELVPDAGLVGASVLASTGVPSVATVLGRASR